MPSIILTCPKCRNNGIAPFELRDQPVRCKKCGANWIAWGESCTTFEIPAYTVEPSAETAKPAVPGARK